MSTYLMNRTETKEIAPSDVEHVQGTYNGWTLAVDSVEIRFRASFLEHGEPRYDIHVTLHCARVNKEGRRGAQRISEDFHTSLSKAVPVPRWLLAMIRTNTPEWFNASVGDFFEGTDRCTVDTARGPLLTWRAPR